jgi:hypothetical protein
MRSLKSLFSGPNGDLSSKRVFALGCFIMAVIQAFQGAPWEVQSLWLGMAATVLGIQSVTGK